MDRIGRKLLDATKAEISNSGDGDKFGYTESKSLFALLVRANMAPNLPEHQRLSDEAVLSRKLVLLSFNESILNVKPEVPTFLVAGHETTR